MSQSVPNTRNRKKRSAVKNTDSSPPPDKNDPPALPVENFNVMSPDKRETLSIPPDLIEDTSGSKRYQEEKKCHDAPMFSFYLCKMYTSGATCTHGSLCDYIHSRHIFSEKRSEEELSNAPASASRVRHIEVHWSNPCASLTEAPYERHAAGSVLHINQSESRKGDSAHTKTGRSVHPRRLSSEYVYKTKGSEAALETGSTKLLRLCKHFDREKCAWGRLCNFIHQVRLEPRQPAAPAPKDPMNVIFLCRNDGASAMQSVPASIQGTSPNFTPHPYPHLAHGGILPFLSQGAHLSPPGLIPPGGYPLSPVYAPPHTLFHVNPTPTNPGMPLYATQTKQVQQELQQTYYGTWQNPPFSSFPSSTFPQSILPPTLPPNP